MAIVVRIPTPLRAMTKGAAEVHAEASTIGDVITDLERQFPGLRDRIVEESGEIRRFVNIYVNQEDIRFLEGDKTALKPGDEVSIVPAIAGGGKLQAPQARHVRRRAAARAIFDSALAAACGRPLVLRAVAAVTPPAGRVVVVGAGKASGAMASAVEEAWGERVAGGLVVVKDGHLAETRRVRLVEAGHPVPDERGAAAARDLLALALGAAPKTSC
jgi:molybdopterin synthase sulfur carrier subunit